MCEACLVDAVEYGEVLPGIGLWQATKDGHEMKAGQWALTRAGYPFAVFNDKPTPDPTYGWTDDRVNREAGPDHPVWDWLFKARAFTETFTVTPELGHLLIEKALADDYDPANDGFFAIWLWHRMGDVIQAKGT